jgi:glycosyltransferase involved in cell wall biosynthesis
MIDSSRGSNPWLFWFSRLRRIVCRTVLAVLRKGGIRRRFEWLEIRACDRVIPEIYKVARLIEADLYVGHNPGLLPITCKIASEKQAKCGFDAEDIHSGMTRNGEEQSLESIIVGEWESTYLPRYDYLTAAAPLFAREYSESCSVEFDAIVLNTFEPQSTRKLIDDSTHDQMSLYWISQTIGAHRGLEDVVRAVSLLRDLPVRVYLRGEWQVGYERKLWELAEGLQVTGNQLISLPRVPFEDFVGSACGFDVGLAVEEPTSLNRELCLTNKILMYLSAGLAVAATATRAQSELMSNIPEAGFVYSWGDHVALAQNLRAWWERPDSLRTARKAALQAAEDRYNWRSERAKLARVIDRQFQ